MKTIKFGIELTEEENKKLIEIGKENGRPRKHQAAHIIKNWLAKR